MRVPVSDKDFQMPQVHLLLPEVLIRPIYDESGNEYSEEEAISTAGKYTVEYRFKDPKSGWIKNTAKLEIEVITEEFTGNDIVVKNNTMSKDYNFRTGVSCKNNLGQEAELTGVVIKKVNIETEEEDVLTQQPAAN